METYYGLVKGSEPITLCMHRSPTLSPTKCTGEPRNQLQKRDTAGVLSRHIIRCWAALISLAAGEPQLQGIGERGARILFQMRLEPPEPNCVAHCHGSSCEGQWLWRMRNVSLTPRRSEGNGEWGQLWAWGQQARCGVNQPPKLESLH